jgi:hypothetical protein
MVLTTLMLSMSRLSGQCRILNISQPYRPPRPVTGISFILIDKTLKSMTNSQSTGLRDKESHVFLTEDIKVHWNCFARGKLSYICQPNNLLHKRKFLAFMKNITAVSRNFRPQTVSLCEPKDPVPLTDFAHGCASVYSFYRVFSEGLLSIELTFFLLPLSPSA